MIRWLIAILFSLSLVEITAQVELTRALVGSGGLNSTNSVISITSSAGEAVVRTESSQDVILTQGFQQPLAKSLLSFVIDVTDAACPSSSDGAAAITDVAGCAGPYTIVWSSGHEGQEVQNLPPGDYSVTVSSPNCSTTQEFTVEPGLASACAIQFLNAFSPNGDGINDTWIIVNVELEEYQDNSVEIFNRWGQMIWSIDDYDNGERVWRGRTNGGEELSSGTYYYIVKVGETTHKGYIELTR